MKTLLASFLALTAVTLPLAAVAQTPTPAVAVTQPVAVPVTAVPAGNVPTGSLQELVGERLSHFNMLTLIVGYLAVTLIGLFGFIILWRIFTGKIDITLLISESDGAASLSRFQFLIFTFVISLSLMLVILGKEGGPGFPASIPAGIYALLGISAASYVVSKGIQSGADTKAREDNYCVPPDNENAG